MNRTSLIPLIAVLAVPGMAAAQSFAGNYRLQDPQGTTTMIIQQDAGGRVSGTLTMDDGSVVNLNGEIKGTEALGIATLGEKNTLFKLNFQGEQLIYTMIAVTTDNKPDLANAQQFPFERAGGGLAGTGPSTGGGRNPLTGGAASDPFTGVFSDGKMRLELEGEKVVAEEHLLTDLDKPRVRDIRQGSDGAIYIVTGEANGKILRIVPAKE